MDATLHIEGTHAHVSIVGNFDFALHRTFRDVASQITSHAQIRTAEIDFSRVTRIDSSALGMMLLLRERLAARRATLTLVNMSQPIRSLLVASQFHRLFNMPLPEPGPWHDSNAHTALERAIHELEQARSKGLSRAAAELVIENIACSFGPGGSSPAAKDAIHALLNATHARFPADHTTDSCTA
ncbi:STAS domain-containing protein [Chitinimonas naiadis]